MQHERKKNHKKDKSFIMVQTIEMNLHLKAWKKDKERECVTLCVCVRVFVN